VIKNMCDQYGEKKKRKKKEKEKIEKNKVPVTE
jgi:hypothetical protein